MWYTHFVKIRPGEKKLSEDIRMNEIKRDLYLNRLIEKQGNGLIKIVTGIRRCGKSYLLFELFRKYLLSTGVKERQIIALSLDEDENAEYLDPANLSRYLKSKILNDEETFYILLDEVQLAITDDEYKGKSMVRLYGIFNSLLKRGNVDVYITGSNSKFLSSDVLTEFRGRGDEVRVYPLTFAEFMSEYPGDSYAGYREYSLYGGLPYILAMKTPEAKAKYLDNLFKNTYIKDIVERRELKGDIVMGTLVDILASDTATLTNPTKLANSFTSHSIKTNGNTVSVYIDYLLDAFIISKAQRYDIKGKRYIGSPFKYYFTDIGLRNARLNFRQIEPTHAMENILYNELIIRGFNVDVGVVERYGKNDKGQGTVSFLEVDFVCNKGSQRYYVQSAFSIPDKEKMAQEQASLDRIDDSFKKVIVVQDNVAPWHNEKGYLIINILDFLLNANSLDF